MRRKCDNVAVGSRLTPSLSRSAEFGAKLRLEPRNAEVALSKRPAPLHETARLSLLQPNCEPIDATRGSTAEKTRPFELCYTAR